MTSKLGSGKSLTPKGTSVHKRHRMSHHAQSRSTGVTCAREGEITKEANSAKVTVHFTFVWSDPYRLEANETGQVSRITR